MKKLLLILAFLACAATTQAQTITCSATGATAKQASQYAAMLATVNAQRAAQGLPTFSGFPQHCASVMLAEFTSWVELQSRADAALVGDSAKAHGDETAITAHCTAAGLGAGCTKAQVACFVLTGNTTCK